MQLECYPRVSLRESMIVGPLYETRTKVGPPLHTVWIDILGWGLPPADRRSGLWLVARVGSEGVSVLSVKLRNIVHRAKVPIMAEWALIASYMLARPNARTSRRQAPNEDSSAVLG